MFRPLVLIPTYNTGRALLSRTVAGAVASGYPVLVVVDGSTDGSDAGLEEAFPDLLVLRPGRQGGKGAAVLAGARHAAAEGYTHVLTMDADGQHPADVIAPLFALAEEHPRALVMGQPQFGPEAPLARLKGRKLTIWWTNLETLHGGLGDTLFGMRVYPVEPLLRAFAQTPFARGFDFDPEIAVRLYWLGLPPVRHPVACRYLPREEGGVSHFHYLRDNVKLTLLHFRLMPEFLFFRLWILRRNQRRVAAS